MAFIRGYAAYMKKRRLESEDFYRLLEAIRKSMSTRLSTPKEALASISVESQGAEHFRELVVSGETLSDAFSRLSPSTSLSRGCSGMLSEYFAAFGRGYLDEELRCADEFILRFGKEIERERVCGANDERVVRSVAIAVTLGVIILII